MATTEQTKQKPLEYVGFGVNGFLFKDPDTGALYHVWRERKAGSGLAWVGMKTDDIAPAFLAVGFPEFCGAEIDMRQSDEDEMTEEVMALGDRVAAALNAVFTNEEKRVRGWG